MILKTTRRVAFLHASPSFYSTVELGNSVARFRNIQALAPFNNTTSASVVDDQDSAVYVGIGVGYQWQNTPLRSEIQFSKFGSQRFVDDMFFNGADPERTTVKVKQNMLMLNVS